MNKILKSEHQGSHKMKIEEIVKHLSAKLSAGVGRCPAGWPIRGQEPDAGERNVLHLQTSCWGDVEELPSILSLWQPGYRSNITLVARVL